MTWKRVQHDVEMGQYDMETSFVFYSQTFSLRHPELVSGYHLTKKKMFFGKKKMLKQVQHDG